MTSQKSPLALSLQRAAQQIDDNLSRILAPRDDGNLTEAMRYALLGSGKRMRGYLITETSRMLDVDPQIALNAAGSVECLHTYSLVHDDLPCMDDDDLRRGRPSTHKKFDDATAVLAGDALQTAAFQIILTPTPGAFADRQCELALALAQASGRDGMVGGQALDIAAEGKTVPLDEIRVIHKMKTGALIRYSAEAGAILAGLKPQDPIRQALLLYGTHLGTAFQVADDILDATQSTEELGKTAGKDAAVGKSTYVGELGLEGARAQALKLVRDAQAALAPFGEKAQNLYDLAQYVIDRRN